MEFGRSDAIKSEKYAAVVWDDKNFIDAQPPKHFVSIIISRCRFVPLHFRKQAAGLGPDDSLHVAERLYLKGEGDV